MPIKMSSIECNVAITVCPAYGINPMVVSSRVATYVK